MKQESGCRYCGRRVRKLILFFEDGHEEFYNLKRDLSETTNLSVMDDVTNRHQYDTNMDRRDTNRIEEFIKDLSEEELRYLNRLIVERLKLISQARSTAAMARFNIGESVQFDTEDGRTITGRIIKLNKKTISILTTERQQWNVAPVFLRSVEAK